jgi:hypothetical protein
MKLRTPTNVVKSRTKLLPTMHKYLPARRLGTSPVGTRRVSLESGIGKKEANHKKIRSRSRAHGQRSPNRVTRGSVSTREYPISGFVLVTLQRKLQAEVEFRDNISRSILKHIYQMLHIFFLLVYTI